MIPFFIEEDDLCVEIVTLHCQLILVQIQTRLRFGHKRYGESRQGDLQHTWIRVLHRIDLLKLRGGMGMFETSEISR